ncbi:MAG: hypothetical protein RLZZ584_3120 [Pseudomonadota bacterium]|jgi:iron-sulfur cluster assembly protein
MLSLTPRATRHVLDTATRSGAAGQALRVAAQLTAEGDVRFGLGFDEQREADEVLSFGELVVLVGSPSRDLLSDVELDVEPDEDGQPRFVFIRPPGTDPVESAGGAAGTQEQRP